MTATLVAGSGTFASGGETSVNRLGYGAMQITGRGVWGDPAEPRGGGSAFCAGPSSSE